MRAWARPCKDCARSAACVGLGLRCSAELYEEEASAFGEEWEIGEGFLFAAEGVEEEAVHAFEADGLVREDEWDVVCGDEDVFEADADEGAELWALDEIECGTEDDGAGAFAADEGSGYVEVAFGEKLVEVEAGDAAGNVGELCADLIGVGVADALELGVDFSGAASGGDVGG